MRGAQLVFAKLANADFLGADLAGALYSPDGEGSTSSLPAISGIARANNLETVRFIDPSPIYALRASFRELGYRDAERKLTYVVERASTEEVCSTPTGDRLQCLMRRVFMQWPTSYGLFPSRALQAICVLVGGFSVLYLAALMKSGESHIWRVWNKERIARAIGSDAPEPIQLNRYTPLWAFYFSVISASQIGWKDLTLGNWIARVQRGEYSLHGTGWVRTASGIQAVTTVYLLAIWALTYFGRPFG